MVVSRDFLQVGDAGIHVADAYAGLPGNDATNETAALATLQGVTMDMAGGLLLLSLGAHRFSTETVDKVLIIPEGALVKPLAGHTITFAKRPVAGRYPIADLSLGGAIAFADGAADEIYPEWIGASGDGVTDESDAWAALNDALPAGGSTVLLRPLAEHRVSDGIALSASNFTLRGDWAAKIRCTDDEMINAITIAAGTTDVLIEGVHVHAGQLVQDNAFDYRDRGNCIYVAGTIAEPCARIRVKGCKFTDGHNGILFVYCNDSEAVGNHLTFSHDGLIGINLRGCNRVQVEGNHLTSLHATGMCTAIEAVNATSAQEGSNNFVNNTIKGTFRLEGLNILTSYNLITGNNVNITGTCLALVFSAGAGTTTCHHNIATCNRFETTSDSLRTVGLLDQGLPGQPRLGANDNVIAHNIIIQNGAAWALLCNDYCSRNRFIGNWISAVNATFDVVVVIGTSADRNRVLDNYIKGGAAARQALYINSAPNTVVRGNEVCNSLGRGIAFEVCLNPTCVDNDTHDNAGSGWALVSCTGRQIERENVDDNNGAAPNVSGTFTAFPANTANPSVEDGGDRFRTANTVLTTYGNWPGGYAMREIWIRVDDNFTVLDFTGSSLRGRTADYTCTSGQMIHAIHDGTNWHVTVLAVAALPSNIAYVDAINSFVQPQGFYGSGALAAVLFGRVTGDTQNRWQDLASGERDIGTGLAATDIRVGRISANLYGLPDAGDSLYTQGSAWNEGHWQMNAWHFWVDGSGFYRMKSGAPSSATDGAKLLRQSTNLTATPPASISNPPTQAEVQGLLDYVVDIVAKSGLS